jgi:hypothetical protein
VLYCLGDRERQIEVIVVVFLSASNNPFVVLRISVSFVDVGQKLRIVFIEGRGKTERERERERERENGARNCYRGKDEGVNWAVDLGITCYLPRLA